MIEMKLVPLLIGTGIFLTVFADDIGQELFRAIVVCLS